MNRLAYFINETDADDGEITPCIAEEYVAGYSRVNYSWKCTMAEAKELVDGLNERIGITKRDAFEITASSMRAQNLTAKRETEDE